MYYLLSWYNDKDHERKAKLFKEEKEAIAYAESKLKDDEIIDYDFYVSYTEYKCVKREVESLKSKIASAIYTLQSERR